MPTTRSNPIAKAWPSPARLTHRQAVAEKLREFLL